MNTLVVGFKWSGQSLHMSDRATRKGLGAYQGGPEIVDLSQSARMRAIRDNPLTWCHW